MTRLDKLSLMQVLDALLSEYEKLIQGPGKWQKLAVFLQQRFVVIYFCQVFFWLRVEWSWSFLHFFPFLKEHVSVNSFEGPVLDLFKRVIDKVESEKSSLALQRRLNEDKLTLLTKRLEASEGEKSEYIKRYEDAINDKKKLTDEYMNRITELQANRRSLDERYSNLLKTLDSTKHESMDWKRKYDQVLSRQKAEEDQASSEIASLKSRSSAAEARLAAAREQAQSAQEEAGEWKRKYDVAVREAKSALEKAAIVQERTNKQTQLREDVLREEFSGTLAEKVSSPS
jgi:chromosome segregation ATPase